MRSADCCAGSESESKSIRMAQQRYLSAKAATSEGGLQSMFAQENLSFSANGNEFHFFSNASILSFVPGCVDKKSARPDPP